MIAFDTRNLFAPLDGEPSVDDVMDVLSARAALYGGSAADMLDKTPPHLWDNPNEILMFWDEHHLSHIYPQSDFPDMADDWTNIVPENPTDNMSRGAEIMTPDEILAADIDTADTADVIDTVFDGDDPEFASDLMDAVFA
jgi:hypothetical protein